MWSGCGGFGVVTKRNETKRERREKDTSKEQPNNGAVM